MCGDLSFFWRDLPKNGYNCWRENGPASRCLSILTMHRVRWGDLCPIGPEVKDDHQAGNQVEVGVHDRLGGRHSPLIDDPEV